MVVSVTPLVRASHDHKGKALDGKVWDLYPSLYPKYTLKSSNILHYMKKVFTFDNEEKL